MNTHEKARPFEWADSYLLGHAPMDATHQEFVEIVNALLVCADGDVLAHLHEFALHARAHFAQEERWMLESAYPGSQCHADEHAAVLKSVDEVLAVLQMGRSASLGRKLAAALADWFPRHTDHIDSALAQWLVKRKTGGIALVFKRKPH